MNLLKPRKFICTAKKCFHHGHIYKFQSYKCSYSSCKDCVEYPEDIERWKRYGFIPEEV